MICAVIEVWGLYIYFSPAKNVNSTNTELRFGGKRCQVPISTGVGEKYPITNQTQTNKPPPFPKASQKKEKEVNKSH